MEEKKLNFGNKMIAKNGNIYTRCRCPREYWENREAAAYEGLRPYKDAGTWYLYDWSEGQASEEFKTRWNEIVASYEQSRFDRAIEGLMLRLEDAGIDNLQTPRDWDEFYQVINEEANNPEAMLEDFRLNNDIRPEYEWADVDDYWN